LQRMHWDELKRERSLHYITECNITKTIIALKTKVDATVKSAECIPNENFLFLNLTTTDVISLLLSQGLP